MKPRTKQASEKPGKPLALFCPSCQTRHVDEGEWAGKPHRTHLCAGCGHLWTPEEFNTVGVEEAFFCPCRSWAREGRVGDNLSRLGHHPFCDGTGHHKPDVFGGQAMTTWKKEFNAFHQRLEKTKNPDNGWKDSWEDLGPEAAFKAGWDAASKAFKRKMAPPSPSVPVFTNWQVVQDNARPFTDRKGNALVFNTKGEAINAAKTSGKAYSVKEVASLTLPPDPVPPKKLKWCVVSEEGRVAFNVNGQPIRFQAMADAIQMAKRRGHGWHALREDKATFSGVNGILFQNISNLNPANWHAVCALVVEMMKYQKG